MCRASSRRGFWSELPVDSPSQHYLLVAFSHWSMQEFEICSASRIRAERSTTSERYRKSFTWNIAGRQSWRSAKRLARLDNCAFGRILSAAGPATGDPSRRRSAVGRAGVTPTVACGAVAREMAGSAGSR
jgi:hypothetical protein